MTFLKTRFRRAFAAPAEEPAGPLDHPEIARMSRTQLDDLPFPRHPG